MAQRTFFNHKLEEMHDSVLLLGSRVEETLGLALAALASRDVEKAAQVFHADEAINHARYQIEDDCFMLITRQQPVITDLRRIISAMSIAVDLERMGDQAKGIAKIVEFLQDHPEVKPPSGLESMGKLAQLMLSDAMTAYDQGDPNLARQIAALDDEVDALYGRIFAESMKRLTNADEEIEVESCYEMLRAARELERFCDLATNISERTVYQVTGAMAEVNVEDRIPAS